MSRREEEGMSREGEGVNGREEKDFDRIRERMQNFNAPPVTPKDDMWPAIQASWADQARKRGIVRIRNRWVGYSAAAAALIVLGVAIGRLSTVSSPSPADVVAADLQPARGGVSLTHQLAASRHFSQAETLLLLFQTATAAEDVAPLARSLLTTTRLLLDSRAANDLRVRALLLDLELVLSQMVLLQPDNDVGEREFINEGLDGSALLPRLRNLIPTSPVQRAGV